MILSKGSLNEMAWLNPSTGLEVVSVLCSTFIHVPQTGYFVHAIFVWIGLVFCTSGHFTGLHNIQRAYTPWMRIGLSGLKRNNAYITRV